ncbi:MAG: ABC transporter substrate-binding protein, partial [Caldisphaera sp.]|nr:ABC transporter substrate-binding protein [Caldisphaera sp.]
MCIALGGISVKRNISKKNLLGTLSVLLVLVVILTGTYNYVNNLNKNKIPTQTISSTLTSRVTTQYQNVSVISNLQPLMPESYSIQVNQPLEVNIPNFKPGDYALVYDGEGYILNVSSSSFNVSFNYPGQYFLYYILYNNNKFLGSSSKNLIQIIVFPFLNFNQSNLLTIPVISLSSGSILTSGKQFNISLGFLQPPSGINITIKEYILSLGNGTNIIIPSKNST